MRKYCDYGTYHDTYCRLLTVWMSAAAKELVSPGEVQDNRYPFKSTIHMVRLVVVDCNFCLQTKSKLCIFKIISFFHLLIHFLIKLVSFMLKVQL